MCNAYRHSAGCTCGWGGDGHLGRADHSFVQSNVYERGVRTSFCRPTSCQYCGEHVFFVRYNGGCVWFDALGKPWPKHQCYNNFSTNSAAVQIVYSQQDKEVISVFQNHDKYFPDAALGTVIYAEQIQNDKHLNVLYTDNTEGRFRFHSEHSIFDIIDEILIMSISKETIVFPFLNSRYSSYIDVPILPPENQSMSSRIFYCPWCTNHFMDMNELNVHLLTQHGKKR